MNCGRNENSRRSERTRGNKTLPEKPGAGTVSGSKSGIYRAIRRKNMECIEWLFFDVGSTLMNEEKAYLHRLHDVADAVNKTFEEIYDMAITLYKENKKGDLEIMRLYGLPKLKWYKEDEDLYADTFEVLDELSKKYKIGVIANQSLGTAERLEQKGILKFIDLVIASAEEGISKPDKRIFEIALSRAECNAENAVMIGDRIDNDIVPAKQIGMKTIWIKQGFGKYWNVAREEEKADYEVDNLISILSLLG
jgi:8-oxo-dGTP diphosphatase/putative hydrolase of the HAD superfamily